MQNNRITSHPPKKTAEDFILEAASGSQKRVFNELKVKNRAYPWDEEYVREDVQKVFTVKLPEAYILKIKFISELTNKSQQKIVREIVCASVDEVLKELDK